MNVKDFIDYVITFDNVDDILDNYKTQSEKGFIFERLFDIIIKFGFCDVFINSDFNHLIGNSNKNIILSANNISAKKLQNIMMAILIKVLLICNVTSKDLGCCNNSKICLEL